MVNNPTLSAYPKKTYQSGGTLTLKTKKMNLFKRNRSTEGTYSLGWRFHLKTVGIILLGIPLAALGSYAATKELKIDEQIISWLTPVVEAEYSYQAPNIESMPGATFEQKLNALKDELVNDLAAKCESKNVKDPEGLIVFDSNAKASLGPWQWQVASVQHVVKQLDGIAISQREAIEIAIDYDRAGELTKRTLFEIKDGHRHWLNCSNKLGLSSQIELIKRIEN